MGRHPRVHSRRSEATPPCCTRRQQPSGGKQPSSSTSIRRPGQENVAGDGPGRRAAHTPQHRPGADADA